MNIGLIGSLSSVDFSEENGGLLQFSNFPLLTIDELVPESYESFTSSAEIKQDTKKISNLMNLS